MKHLLGDLLDAQKENRVDTKLRFLVGIYYRLILFLPLRWIFKILNVLFAKEKM